MKHVGQLVKLSDLEPHEAFRFVGGDGYRHYLVRHASPTKSIIGYFAGPHIYKHDSSAVVKRAQPDHRDGQLPEAPSN